MVKTSLGQPVLCLFSIICFGKERDKPFLGPGCKTYNYNKESVSVHCSGPEHQIIDPPFGSDLHVLAIDREPKEDFKLKLHALPFKHLIIRDWDMSTFFKDISPNIFSTQQHKSLTVLGVKNVQAWRWSDYQFEHIHIEDSDLTKVGSQRLSESLSLKLFSWKLKSLSITRCQLLTVETNVFYHTINLQSLIITHNELSSLSAEIFPKFVPKLRILDLSYNSLITVQKELFERVPNLRELSLKHNHLVQIPFDLVRPVWQDLDVINLVDNSWKCQELCWSYDVKSFPHPPFFDFTSCSHDFNDHLVIGSNNRYVVGCTGDWWFYWPGKHDGILKPIGSKSYETHLQWNQPVINI